MTKKDKKANDNKKNYGHGINDLPEVKTSCSEYSSWNSVLKRVYSFSWMFNNKPTYVLATCSDDFKKRSKFKKFFDETNFKYEHPLIKGKMEWCHLDKDILIPGNNHYSFDTCVYVPQFVNQAFVCTDRGGKGLPQGVKESVLKVGGVPFGNKKGYKVKVTLHGKVYDHDGFESILEAHKFWQGAKIDSIKRIAEDYKHVCPVDRFNQKIYDKILDKANDIQIDYDNNFFTYIVELEGIRYIRIKNKFEAFIIERGVEKVLGDYKNAEAAHERWQKEVLNQITDKLQEVVDTDAVWSVPDIEFVADRFLKLYTRIETAINNKEITTEVNSKKVSKGE